jgi:WD40 repeat protein
LSCSRVLPSACRIGAEYAAARWDFASGRYLGRRLLPPGGGNLPLSPDQPYAVTSGTPYDVALFDVLTGATRPLRFDDRDLVRRRAPVVSANGKLVAAPTDDGNEPPGNAGVPIWEVAPGDRVARLPVAAAMVRFTPDGRGLAAAEETGVGVGDPASRTRLVWHPAHTTVPGGAARTPVSTWDVTPDGKTLATGHADGTILLWNLTAPARSR